MRLLLLSLVSLALAGCATREVGTVRPAPAAWFDSPVPETDDNCRGKAVWITIDGTSNTPVSRTAAARLHEMVEAYSYLPPARPLAIWYAEGVGSADHDILGKVLGVGVDEDIRKAYSFLTRVWRPCDRLFLNGFSRGAYTVRALGGLLYMAGIPDLSALDEAERRAVVDDLFDAYKTGKPGRAERIAAARARHKGYIPEEFPASARGPGFLNPHTRVTIEAMTIWDTVQAIGRPDRIEDPTEWPAHFLITACNAKAIFQPLALDDNRVYSFTPLLAGGPQATEICPDPEVRQNESPAIEEVWFSGAHADVGGTYEDAGAMLDGELASVSLNWVLSRLGSTSGHILGLPEKLRLPEDRLSAVHDGKRTSPAYRKLYRQSRKPLVYWYHAYGAGAKAAVHASVFDRLEWLFALDETTAGCKGTTAPGKPVICAEEIASHSLVPELLKGRCLEATDWGYRLTKDQDCVEMVGLRSEIRPKLPEECGDSGTQAFFMGMVYEGPLAETRRDVVHRVRHPVPYPRCRTDPASRASR
jgi:hypothetical protein